MPGAASVPALRIVPAGGGLTHVLSALDVLDVVMLAAGVHSIPFLYPVLFHAPVPPYVRSFPLGRTAELVGNKWVG